MSRTERNVESSYDQMLSALQTLATSATVQVAGRIYTQADLIQVVRAIVAPMKEVKVARAAYEKAVSAERANAPGAAKMLREIRTGIKALFGEDSADLKAYGIKAFKKPRELTVEEKALRAAKARRTRELRHTLGPKAREAIKSEPIVPVSFPRPGPASGTSTPGDPSRIPA